MTWEPTSDRHEEGCTDWITPSMGSLLLTQEHYLEWNNSQELGNTWFVMLWFVWLSWPSPSAFTEDLKSLSLGCSEGRIPKDSSAPATWCTNTQHGHTSALPYTLWIIHIYRPHTNLIKPFWLSGKHRCSPLHQCQKVQNSWVSAQLQLFTISVQNKTISLITSTVHYRVTSPRILSYNSEH